MVLPEERHPPKHPLAGWLRPRPQGPSDRGRENARLTYLLRVGGGHDALHTLDLPNGNRTSDDKIAIGTVREGRVLITKDAEFVASFLLTYQPYKRLLISTGNIRSIDLEAPWVAQLPAIASACADHVFLELTRSAFTVRERHGIVVVVNADTPLKMGKRKARDTEHASARAPKPTGVLHRRPLGTYLLYVAWYTYTA